MLIYIHGLNSSALSYKAGVVRKRMAELRRATEFLCPELPHRPSEAIALLDALVQEHRGERPALVGSSLGGFYATWLAEHRDVRAVLVNPAVRPYRFLAQYCGPQTNLYTGARYELTAQHIAELRALEVERITPERYLLMVQTGDEVLDYRDAVERYHGCEQVIVDGGDHGFADFESHLGRILSFGGLDANCALHERARRVEPLQK